MLGHRTLTPEDYFTILKKRGWVIAVPTILMALVGFGLTYFVPPEYVSQALLLIEQQRISTSFVKPVVSSDLNSRLATMQEQVLSRSRLQPIIEKFNLRGNKGLNMDARIDLVRKDIVIKPPAESQIARTGGLPGFIIAFTASDAHTAQQACAEITALFISASLSEQEKSAEGTNDFLKAQLDDAKRNLDEQDAKLADFQRANMGVLPDQQGANMGMMQSLNSQLDAATQAISSMEQNKTYAESMLSAQLRDIPNPGDTTKGPGPQIQQTELNALLLQEADLTSHYTDNYPDVVTVRRKIRELRAEMAKAPAPAPAPAPVTTAKANEPINIVQMRAQIRAMESTIAQKKRDQASIQAELRNYQAKIGQSPMVQEQFKQVTRDHETAMAFYNELLQKMNQSKMATDLERRQQGEQFKLMDEPNLPESPAFPKRPIFFSGGLGFGILLGLIIVGWMEYRDTAIRSEGDLWAFTKLPTLAVISLAAEIQPREPRKRFKIGGDGGKNAPATNPLVNAGG